MLPLINSHKTLKMIQAAKHATLLLVQKSYETVMRAISFNSKQNWSLWQVLFILLLCTMVNLEFKVR